MKTVYSDLNRLHFPQGELFGGKMVTPFDRPERCERILDELKLRGYTEILEPGELDFDLVNGVHAPELVNFLADAWQQWKHLGMDGDAVPNCFPARRMHTDRIPECIEGKLAYYCLSTDTAITSETWTSVKSSAACAVKAQQTVAKDGTAFALCRPPGHHAASSMYGAYCFLNNAAIAVQGFLRDGAGRVALLDIDFHHGNGSQDIFYERDDVLYASLHGQPEYVYPYFLGFCDERGAGAGEGFNFNMPMPPGTDSATWLQSLRDAIRVIAEYSPDAVVVSHGVDTFKDDPMSFFTIHSDDYIRCGKIIGRLKLPTLFVLEGGYAMDTVGINTVNVLDGFYSTWI